MSDASVVQADREAAAAMVRWQREATEAWENADGEARQFFVPGFSRAIIQGIWDEHDVVQAFARHRIASTDGLVEALRAVSIPRDIADQVLSMGRAEWGATASLDQAGHLAHLAESLRLTREHFNFEDTPVPMHGLYLDGETVLCHTGTSPNSGANAQALTGAWNWLYDQCAALTKAGAL